MANRGCHVRGEKSARGIDGRAWGCRADGGADAGGTTEGTRCGERRHRRLALLLRPLLHVQLLFVLQVHVSRQPGQVGQLVRSQYSLLSMRMVAVGADDRWAWMMGE